MNLYKFIGHFGALLPNESNDEVEVKYGKSSDISSAFESDRRFLFANHQLSNFF